MLSFVNFVALLFVVFLFPSFGYAQASASKAKAGNCPAPSSADEGPGKLRQASIPAGVKKFKIKVDKGGKNIGLPAPKGLQPPAEGECFFVFARNQQDVVAEIVFQKVTKNAKGVSVWVFSPHRRSEAGKTTLNLEAVQASLSGSGAAAVSSVGSSEALLSENPLVLPAFFLIQNAQHQAANVRTGLALNIPVSGFGAAIEAFVPKLSTGAWTNMIGLRIHIANWTAEKFVFRKPIANDNQDAIASGNLMQVDVMLRYPLANSWLPRVGVFVAPVAKQTEILKAEASALSPENTQTVVRSGLVLGAEMELQPSNSFFLQGRVSMSTKETVTVKDDSPVGGSLSGAGTATRLHLTGIAGVRIPLIASKKLMFEGLVGNTYRSDKYSPEVANVGQEQQKDVLTFFQAGFGYFL